MKILIADDHQYMINSLKTIVNYAFEDVKTIHFVEAQDCKTAIFEINAFSAANESFDLAILDFSMPAYMEKNILNGGDVCLFLREKMPSCKTLIFTAHLEDLILLDIDQKVKPDALIIKSDVKPEELITICSEVIKGKKYSSPTVIEKKDKMWVEEIFTKESNRKIVELLSKGYKIKEIASELLLTEVAIQKRLAKIKQGLNITDDSSILREVKRRGYV